MCCKSRDPSSIKARSLERFWSRLPWGFVHNGAVTSLGLPCSHTQRRCGLELSFSSKTQVTVISTWVLYLWQRLDWIGLYLWLTVWLNCELCGLCPALRVVLCVCCVCVLCSVTCVLCFCHILRSCRSVSCPKPGEIQQTRLNWHKLAGYWPLLP